MSANEQFNNSLLINEGWKGFTWSLSFESREVLNHILLVQAQCNIGVMNLHHSLDEEVFMADKF